MNDIEKLQSGLLFVAGVLIVAAIGLAWLAYAEHPTAGNFRRATLMTLKDL
ncbi:MAG TPA: hypothetical protein VIO57_11055 [Chloroflexota bacterium]|jgi:hypothetical protein